jgi:hypothetical protein
MLFTLRDDLIKSPKLLIYIDKELRNPEPDEVTAFKTVNRTDKKTNGECPTALVNIPSDNLRTELARKELYALLVGMMEETLENCLIRVQKLLHGLTEFVLLKVLLTKVMKSHCFLLREYYPDRSHISSLYIENWY